MWCWHKWGPWTVVSHKEKLAAPLFTEQWSKVGEVIVQKKQCEKCALIRLAKQEIAL